MSQDIEQFVAASASLFEPLSFPVKLNYCPDAGSQKNSGNAENRQPVAEKLKQFVPQDR
ncbi:MAG: hypothetical protein K0U74_03215 [Alphaproteobacteria bacterium]|nr:hypothetical protein [Alphaproteobacteria bacterium]